MTNLKSFLLKPGYVPDGEDPIDQILADIRKEGTLFLFSGPSFQRQRGGKTAQTSPWLP